MRGCGCGCVSGAEGRRGNDDVSGVGGVLSDINGFTDVGNVPSVSAYGSPLDLLSASVSFQATECGASVPERMGWWSRLWRSDATVRGCGCVPGAEGRRGNGDVSGVGGVFSDVNGVADVGNVTSVSAYGPPLDLLSDPLSAQAAKCGACVPERTGWWSRLWRSDATVRGCGCGCVYGAEGHRGNGDVSGVGGLFSDIHGVADVGNVTSVSAYDPPLDLLSDSLSVQAAKCGACVQERTGWWSRLWRSDATVRGCGCVPGAEGRGWCSRLWRSDATVRGCDCVPGAVGHRGNGDVSGVGGVFSAIDGIAGAGNVTSVSAYGPPLDLLSDPLSAQAAKCGACVPERTGWWSRLWRSDATVRGCGCGCVYGAEGHRGNGDVSGVGGLFSDIHGVADVGNVTSVSAYDPPLDLLSDSLSVQAAKCGACVQERTGWWSRLWRSDATVRGCGCVPGAEGRGWCSRLWRSDATVRGCDCVPGAVGHRGNGDVSDVGGVFSDINGLADVGNVTGVSAYGPPLDLLSDSLSAQATKCGACVPERTGRWSRLWRSDATVRVVTEGGRCRCSNSRTAVRTVPSLQRLPS